MEVRKLKMKLNDIELDLPFLEKNGDTISNYQNFWKEKRIKFRMETRCMTAMVARLMGEKGDQNFWKITVCCVQKDNDFEDMIIDGVLHVYVLFDYDHYVKLSELQKCILVIDTISEAIKKIKKEFNISLPGVESALEQVKRMNYNNTWIWKKTKKYQKTFCVEVNHKIDQVRLKLLCLDSTGRIVSEKYVVEQPDEWFYAQLLGKLQVSKCKATLLSKTGNIVLEINI